MCFGVSQEREKRYMIPLEGLRVKDVDDKLFAKHLFALYNPEARYVWFFECSASIRNSLH